MLGREPVADRHDDAIRLQRELAAQRIVAVEAADDVTAAVQPDEHGQAAVPRPAACRCERECPPAGPGTDAIARSRSTGCGLDVEDARLAVVPVARLRRRHLPVLRIARGADLVQHRLRPAGQAACSASRCPCLHERVRFLRRLEDVRRDPPARQRLAELEPQERAGRVARRGRVVVRLHVAHHRGVGVGHRGIDHEVVVVDDQRDFLADLLAQLLDHAPDAIDVVARCARACLRD